MRQKYIPKPKINTVVFQYSNFPAILEILIKSLLLESLKDASLILGLHYLWSSMHLHLVTVEMNYYYIMFDWVLYSGEINGGFHSEQIW